jgi:uncharacterized protein YndB with AHSA1/START domain
MCNWYVAGMEPTVERQLDLDAPPEEVWEALATPAAWLADEGTLPLEPGAVGHLVEDGRSRTAIVEEVEDGRRLVYRWWDDAAADDASRVEITLTDADGGTRVVVREWAITSVLDARGTVLPLDDWDRRFTWLSFEASARTLVRA